MPAIFSIHSDRMRSLLGVNVKKGKQITDASEQTIQLPCSSIDHSPVELTAKLAANKYGLPMDAPTTGEAVPGKLEIGRPLCWIGTGRTVIPSKVKN